MNTLVSIIIPTFNRANLIGETLDSIIRQTYNDWECIIVDDGSNDDSEQVIEKYVESDRRFLYFNRPQGRQKGANACRNYGFEQSKGFFIKWFDSDDIMHPNFLHNQISKFNKFRGLDFVVCQSLTFNENTDIVSRNEANRNPKESLILSYLTKNHYFLTGAPLWRRNFLEGKDLFDESLSDSHESDFHFRMLLANPNYRYVNDFLYSVRRGNQSITQDNSNRVSSLEAKIAFFLKAKYLSKQHGVQDFEVVNDYLTFRISSTIYQLCGLLPRKTVFSKNKNTILHLICQRELGLRYRCKLIIGFITLLIFGKGYSFLRENLNIRQEIVN